jgi:uncharacterized protein (UPF0333 family)
MCKLDNRGSATVELSLIMPVILLVIVLLIRLYMGLISEGSSCGESYSTLYLYEASELSDTVDVSAGSISIRVVSETDDITYKTEYDKCSSRLRRWQMYGDVIH